MHVPTLQKSGPLEPQQNYDSETPLKTYDSLFLAKDIRLQKMFKSSSSSSVWHCGPEFHRTTGHCLKGGGTFFHAQIFCSFLFIKYESPNWANIGSKLMDFVYFRSRGCVRESHAFLASYWPREESRAFFAFFFRPIGTRRKEDEVMAFSWSAVSSASGLGVTTCV